MAYAITLKLNSLKDSCVRYSSSPDDAAKIAWQLLVDNNRSVGIFRQGWVMKTWDTMEGEYENNPIEEHMVRGSPGTHPDNVEFIHCVVDQLTNDTSKSAAIYATSNFPYTPEPNETRMKFEMKRGSEKLSLVFSEEHQLSLVDEFAPVLKDAVKKATGADELDGLVSLLEATLHEIKQSQTNKRPRES